MMPYLNFMLQYPFFSLAVFICFILGVTALMEGVANIVKEWRQK